ncbi:MAG: S41 family peptidase [Spirochaetota bacterium]
MKMKRITYLGIFFVVLIGALGFSISCVTEQPSDNVAASPLNLPALEMDNEEETESQQDTISRDMDRLESLYRTIEQEFLFETESEEIYDSLAKALFKALDDPYSEYITEEESQDITDLTRGVYGGIGAYISKPNPDTVDKDDPKTYMVTIVSPFSGSPAYRAGLHAGDLLSHIDGEEVTDLTVQEASSKLRGEPGTKVKLRVHRGSSTFTVSVEREIVEVPTVEADMIDSIGYIHILEFTPKTAERVQEAIDDFSEEGGFSSIILDVRSNPGGAVEAGQQVADMFLDGGEVLTIESNDPQQTTTLGTRKQTLVPADTPVVVLIDGGTASTSEILSGALKDHERATLIGTETFGKGLVQSVFPYGDDFFKLTTAKYLTPDGHDLHETGIQPDIAVDIPELSEDQIEEYVQLQEEQVFREFVDEHPEQDEQEIEDFITSLKEEKEVTLSDRYLRRLIRQAYERKMDFPPVYDLEYDIVLQRAVEYLESGE